MCRNGSFDTFDVLHVTIMFVCVQMLALAVVLYAPSLALSQGQSL